MRIVKQADVRKNEILDAAAALFAEKGFEGTSTNDLLEAVGIARGTLYHHFKSKEDIMDALIERQTQSILSRARKAAQDKSIPVEERMLRTVLSLHVEGAEGTEQQEMLDHLHKPQNALMHQKIQAILLQNVPPILADILKDGIREGIFDTPFPLECMEMVLTYTNTIFDNDICPLSPEQLSSRIMAFIFHLERMLGAKEGQFSFIAQMFSHLKGV